MKKSMLWLQSGAEQLSAAAVRVASSREIILGAAKKNFRKLAQVNLISLGLPLALILIFTPFYSGLSAQYAIAHPARIIAIFMAIVAVWIVFRNGLRIKLHSLDIFFISFVAIVIGSLVLVGTQDKKQGIVYVMSVMLVPYIFARLLKKSDTKVFVWATFWLALILVPVCIFGISKLMHGDASIERLVLYGQYLGPGTFGIAIGILIPLSILFALSAAADGKKNYIALLILPIAMWTVVTLGSRSVFASELMTSFLILIFARNVGAKFRLKLTAFLLICATISIISLQGSRASFFGKMITDAATPITISANCHIKGNSVAIRKILYTEAIDLFAKNPISGVGAGNFGFYSCLEYEHQSFSSPHSTVLHVLSDLGLIGGLPFFGLVLIASIGLLRRVWRDGIDGNNMTVWMLSSLWVYYFIIDQSSHSYFTVVHFYLLAGVIASVLASGRHGSVVINSDKV